MRRMNLLLIVAFLLEWLLAGPVTGPVQPTWPAANSSPFSYE